jgi:hypothetical protein
MSHLIGISPVKNIGDRIAAQVEIAFGKPTGWLDIHGSFVVVSEHPHKEATLKQLVSDGNKKYLKPLNPHYPIVEYTVNAAIYGVVKQMVCNFLSESSS